MRFVGNYAPCGLSPQTDGMPVIRKIAAFIRDREVEIIYFDSYPLEDIGSILTGTPITAEAEPC